MPDNLLMEFPVNSAHLRKFNRFELKYLVRFDVAKRLKQDLKNFLLPDRQGNNRYAISSLYYDSPDHRFYWEKIEGLRFRRKLRIRNYEAEAPLTDNSKVFVEIKQRVDKVTQKRRLPLTYREAVDLCEEGIIPGHKVDDLPLIEEILMLRDQYSLQPTLVVSYLREAFIGTDYDPGLRVTFDSSITYRQSDLDLKSKTPGRYVLSPDMMIMEVKVNERFPLWLSEIIGSYNFSLIRVSKYCRCLESAFEQQNQVYEIY